MFTTILQGHIYFLKILLKAISTSGLQINVYMGLILDISVNGTLFIQQKSVFWRLINLITLVWTEKILA